MKIDEADGICRNERVLNVMSLKNLNITIRHDVFYVFLGYFLLCTSFISYEKYTENLINKSEHREYLDEHVKNV